VSVDTFDPFRFSLSTDPLPVDGETHPPVREIEAADLIARSYPLWMRLAAAVLAALFLGTTLLTAAVTAGGYSPLTHAGDWQRLNSALPQN
jgi:hypothetical protein